MHVQTLVLALSSVTHYQPVSTKPVIGIKPRGTPPVPPKPATIAPKPTTLPPKPAIPTRQGIDNILKQSRVPSANVTVKVEEDETFEKDNKGIVNLDIVKHSRSPAGHVSHKPEIKKDKPVSYLEVSHNCICFMQASA